MLSWVGWEVEADMMVTIKRHLYKLMNRQGMEEYDADRWNWFNLVSKSAQVSWDEGPVPVLCNSMFISDKSVTYLKKSMNGGTPVACLDHSPFVVTRLLHIPVDC